MKAVTLCRKLQKKWVISVKPLPWYECMKTVLSCSCIITDFYNTDLSVMHPDASAAQHTVMRLDNSLTRFTQYEANIIAWFAT